MILNRFLFQINAEKNLKILKKCITVSTTVFNIDNNNKCFYNKLFLKDHVTLKTGVMDAENSTLPSQE